MADTKIQKQGEVFISQSEYDALRLAGNLQSNTKYHITKTPKTGVDSLEQMNLLNGDKTVTYNTTDGMTVNGQARFTYDGGTTKDVTMDMDIPLVAGEGITIDKKASEEKVEVKLDKTFTDDNFVQKTTTAAVVYGVSSSGTQQNLSWDQAPAANSVAVRDSSGCLNVATTTATSGSNAVNVSYCNSKYVRQATSSHSFVYGRNPVIGNTTYAITEDLSLSGAGLGKLATVAQRDTVGRLQVATPTSSSHATTKAYVDGLHHYVHIINLEGDDQQSYIYITVAAKGKPDPVTTLEEEGSNTSLSSLLYDFGSNNEKVVKVMATGIVYEPDGNAGTVINLSSDGATVFVDYVLNGSITSTNLTSLLGFTITDTVI